MASEFSPILNGSVSQYGNVAAAGKARVHMGDNHYHQSTTSTESDLKEWRGRFFDALAYNDMNGKSQQLGSVGAPTASYDWVETTAIPVWLEQGSGFFWISGKPGSGKSVLMKHLVSTHSTKQHLREWKRDCVILEFFFDFRAGKSEANDISGMLKLFLRQLSSQSEVATKHFRQLNTSRELRDADIAKLSHILSGTVQTCDLPVCAFVDGLDEYEGDWVDLIDVLQRLQDRTGMKICLASRPEPQLKGLLRGYDSISMQDHNIASLRAYIERALIRASRFNPDVDAQFTEHLKDEISLKAQGIILWARLAVDELIRACIDRKSVGEMWQILDALPREVEEMYQRILSKRLYSGFAAESAMIIQIIIVWGGSISLQEIFGLWDLFVQDFSMHVEDFPNMTELAFYKRMDHILGTLVDLLPNDQVRLLHRTLYDYLHATSWVDLNIPRVFTRLFPDWRHTRIYAYVVRRATEDGIVVVEKFDNFLASNGLAELEYDDALAALWAMCDFKGDIHWPRRMPILTQSITGLPSHLADDAEKFRLFKALSSELKSPLMLLACRTRDFRDGDDALQIVLYGPAYRAVVDMVIAVSLGALEYVRWRLQTALVDLAQIQALLDVSIDVMLGSKYANHYTAAFEVATAMARRGARNTRYHSCLIMRHSLLRHACPLDLVLEILFSCPQDLNTGTHCESCPFYRRSKPLVFEWVRKFNYFSGRGSTSRSILNLIIDSDDNGHYYYRETSPDRYWLCHRNTPEEEFISMGALKLLEVAGVEVPFEDVDRPRLVRFKQKLRKVFGK